MRPHLEADRAKVFVPRWRIEPTWCHCGGDLAWYVERPSGAYESAGCVCHNQGPLKPNREPFLVSPSATWTAGSPCVHCGSQRTEWVSFGILLYAHCRRCGESA